MDSAGNGGIGSWCLKLEVSSYGRARREASRRGAESMRLPTQDDLQQVITPLWIRRNVRFDWVRFEMQGKKKPVRREVT